ncbi:hypothetical protein [Marinobacter caseinilyticus]|uniref:hypothetical protein n=1 Tax=Marinobacter caseinilyticus TaxID=2692195 RepID=UPI001F29F900|nr:hypothetical protein [Marinobacter caseinilyticus]
MEWWVMAFDRFTLLRPSGLTKRRLLAALFATCLALPVGAKGTNTETQVPGTSPTITDYILWYRNYDSPAVKALVELALDKTPEYGAYRLIRSSEMGQGRALRELAKGDTKVVDIINVATSPQREQSLLSVPIPIDGGLLGFRVCVVNKENRKRFSRVHSLIDFQQQRFRIGQGLHWPDTDILRANGVSVVTSARFEILFRMLDNDRFDCFARGVNEVLFDLERLKDAGMVVEPYLLFGYPMPSYLFAGPNNIVVAHRLQLGLERAIQDDSFAGYLATYYLEAIERLRLNERTVLMLKNPYLTEDSEPIARRALESLRRRIERAKPLTSALRP